MKGEVFIEVGVNSAGKFWLAAFVVDLENRKDAVDLAPELQRAVTQVVFERVRHGMYVVRSPDELTTGLMSQD